MSPTYSAATRTLFLGEENLFLKGQNVWVGLLFSEFSVDSPPPKKRGHRANMVYFLSEFAVDLKTKKNRSSRQIVLLIS